MSGIKWAAEIEFNLDSQGRSFSMPQSHRLRAVRLINSYTFSHKQSLSVFSTTNALIAAKNFFLQYHLISSKTQKRRNCCKNTSTVSRFCSKSYQANLTKRIEKRLSLIKSETFGWYTNHHHEIIPYLPDDYQNCPRDKEKRPSSFAN